MKKAARDRRRRAAHKKQRECRRRAMILRREWEARTAESTVPEDCDLPRRHVATLAIHGSYFSLMIDPLGW